MNIVIKFEGLGMRGRLGAAGVALALLVSACGTGAAAGADSARIRVVTSTSVYGDLAADVAGTLSGDRVQITSIIDNPNADPHSYEANARTELAISRADLVVENGGGYDDFVSRMRKSAGSDAPVLNAVAISGKHGPDLNEHVWYDFPSMRRLVARIAESLASLDQAHAATFRRNAAALERRIAGLERGAAAIRATHAGTGVAITEPVPLYLLTACGLVNRTPPRFTEAIEEGTDVPTRVLRETLRLFDTRTIALLVYNAQTTSVETRRVLVAARSNDVAVVPVTETLPAGRSYVDWMAGNLAAVRAALS
ncbi:MAG TPA: zinc ABC transporter substrate-binding protein [Jatrophihabitans sp.]|nr:zinc ABC transporter substrate-binding protein [Jatrophihabitans sp.]